jgi:ssDNA-binding replication factor A large subunit
MKNKNLTSNEVSVDEQAFEKDDEQRVDEDGFEIVDETPEFRPSVQMEIQAKVDSNHPNGRLEAGPDHIYGKTLVQEERIQGREAELASISAKAVFGSQEGREERTREIVVEETTARRVEFLKRAGCVNPMVHPDRADPREMLTPEQLGGVNREAMRLADKLGGWSTAAIGRQLAEAVIGGSDLTSAVVGTFEKLQTAPGVVVPIGKLEAINREEVSIEGHIVQLWEPASPAIAQVGLIEDESGRTKFTVWKKSNARSVQEGERVCIHGAAKSWYQGRVSVAVTGWSTIHTPERGRWWE